MAKKFCSELHKPLANNYQLSNTHNIHKSSLNIFSRPFANYSPKFHSRSEQTMKVASQHVSLCVLVRSCVLNDTLDVSFQNKKKCQGQKTDWIEMYSPTVDTCSNDWALRPTGGSKSPGESNSLKHYSPWHRASGSQRRQACRSSEMRSEEFVLHVSPRHFLENALHKDRIIDWAAVDLIIT